MTKEKNIKTIIIHNASILTAIGETGLQLYKFGKTTSIPFKNENVETPYNVIKENQKNKLHTLLLLDLNPKEAKFMTVNDAIRYLLKLEIKKDENVFKDSTLCIGCSKLGSLDQIIKAGKASDLLKHNFKEGIPGSVQLRNAENKGSFVYLENGAFYGTGKIRKITSYQKDGTVYYDAEIGEYKQIEPIQFKNVVPRLSFKSVGQAGIRKISEADFKIITERFRNHSYF